MPRDVNGAYTLPAGTIVTVGDDLLPSQHNPFANDVASALTGSLSRSGLGGMLAPLDMGGFNITNAGIITGTRLQVDAGLYITRSGSIVTIAVDAGAAIQYNTSINTYGLVIGGNTIHSIGATTASFAGTLTIESGIPVGFKTRPRVVSGFERGKTYVSGNSTTITAQAAGDTFFLYNNNNVAIVLTGTGVTLRLAGTTTTGNRTIPPFGYAEVWFDTSSVAVVSGIGVT